MENFLSEAKFFLMPKSTRIYSGNERILICLFLFKVSVFTNRTKNLRHLWNSKRIIHHNIKGKKSEKLISSIIIQWKVVLPSKLIEDLTKFRREFVYL